MQNLLILSLLLALHGIIAYAYLHIFFEVVNELVSEDYLSRKWEKSSFILSA